MPTGFPSPYSPLSIPVQEPVIKMDISFHSNPYLCALMCISGAVFFGRGYEMMQAGTFGLLPYAMAVVVVFSLAGLAWFIREASLQRCYTHALRAWLPYARLPVVPVGGPQRPVTPEEQALVAGYRACEDAAQSLLHDLEATHGTLHSLADVNAALHAAMQHTDTREYQIRVRDHNRALTAWQACC